MPNITLDVFKEYQTWYEFKKDLEKKLGHFLPVNIWLCTKPKKALPWNSHDLQTTLAEAIKMQKSLRAN